MADTHTQLFKGDGVNENATDFLNGIRRRILLTPAWKDDDKLSYFELSLKSGSLAKNWYNKLNAATQKDTFAHLVAAFQTQWPEKEMAEKEKGELQEELLAVVLESKDVGVRIDEDGIQEWGHVRWALKVAELGARVDAGGSLISLALKNIPGSLLLRLGPKRATWPELVQAMKDVPTAELNVVRIQETRMAALEARITELQQTPTRGLSTAFATMAASSPARNDPARRNLTAAFAAVAPNPANPPRAYRPDAERLRMILAAPAIIHPRTPVGIAAYNEQIAVYGRAHGSRPPTEERPYPLTPGTVAVGSGECHKCGCMGHFGSDCTADNDHLIPDIEAKWRRIVQSIRARTSRATRMATPVNIVADASDENSRDSFYPTAEYDAQVIDEWLHSQGKAEGPSA